MKVVMRTEVVVTEEREIELTQEMCNEFCEVIAKTYEAEFEPITLEEIEKYGKGEESKLDQIIGNVGIRGVQLAYAWENWIKDVLCDDGDYYEVDRDCINDEIWYEKA